MLTPQHRSRFPLALLPALLLLSILPLSLTGCADHNPFAYAQTPLDHAHATLRSFEILQMEVLSLMNDPAVSPSAKARLKLESHAGALSSEDLGGVVIDVEAARAELKAGETTSERLAIANAKLPEYIAALKAHINAIKAAQKEARHHE